ncbi:MAG: response regulator, partial [Perlucidibaca sp.]
MKQVMHILVVEDVAASRAWMAERLRAAYAGRSLAADALIVHEAASLARARHLLARLPALDLVLLDLGLPDGGGSELIPELLQRDGDLQVIIATIYDDDEHLFSALRAGARGYLLKDQPAPAFEAALVALQDGVPALSPSIARRLISHFALPASESEGADCLSARERDV